MTNQVAKQFRPRPQRHSQPRPSSTDPRLHSTNRAVDRDCNLLIREALHVPQGDRKALVGRQPFGGFKMSGTGGKAGGPEYLLQFVNQRTITENTMRRGFAPAPEGEENASGA